MTRAGERAAHHCWTGYTQSERIRTRATLDYGAPDTTGPSAFCRDVGGQRVWHHAQRLRTKPRPAFSVRQVRLVAAAAAAASVAIQTGCQQEALKFLSRGLGCWRRSTRCPFNAHSVARFRSLFSSSRSLYFVSLRGRLYFEVVFFLFFVLFFPRTVSWTVWESRHRSVPMFVKSQQNPKESRAPQCSANEREIEAGEGSEMRSMPDTDMKRRTGCRRCFAASRTERVQRRW